MTFQSRLMIEQGCFGGHPLGEELEGVALVGVGHLDAGLVEEGLQLALLPLDARVGSATDELAIDKDLGEGDLARELLRARADHVALVAGRVLEGVEVERRVGDTDRLRSSPMARGVSRASRRGEDAPARIRLGDRGDGRGAAHLQARLGVRVAGRTHRPRPESGPKGAEAAP